MSKQILTTLDFANSGKIENLPPPVADGDAANKAYVDSAVEGIDWKEAVRVATQGNISLASPGASVDGIALAVSDRVLVRAQTAPQQNGIYIWNGAAVPMTRAPDANSVDELEQATVTVEEGTSAGATFRQSSVNFTLDSGAINWSGFGTAAPAATESTAGIVKESTQAQVDAGTPGSGFVAPDKLQNWSGRKQKLSQTIGDAAATQFTITHNFGTRDVHVEVFRTSGNFDSVIVDVERPSANAVRLTFASAPALNAFRAVVIA